MADDQYYYRCDEHCKHYNVALQRNCDTEGHATSPGGLVRWCRVFEPKAKPETKPTNPKDALGIKKVSPHLIPCGPLLEVSLAMLEGGRKYGAHNYRSMGVKASVYYDAAMRHLMAYWEGEDIDPDSNIHHLTKAVACLFVLRDSMLMGNHTDDRPVKHPTGLNIGRLNHITEQVIERYPDCVPPFTAVDHETGGQPDLRMKP